MTRAEQVSHAVRALREAQAAPSFLREPASMTFLIHEGNGGAYHWTIVADDGEALVRSTGFASYEQAEHAAGIVHHGAFRASFAHRSPAPPPVDLSAYRDATMTQDRSDVERWLDEGGSASSEAVTQ